MMKRLLFIHGTGVRDEEYSQTVNILSASLPTLKVERCSWGNGYGSRLHAKGISIPDYLDTDGSAVAAVEVERQQWCQLFEDPLYELRLLREKPPSDTFPPPGKLSPSEQLKVELQKFQPSKTLGQLIHDCGLAPVWGKSYQAIIKSKECAEAIETATDDSTDHRRAIARAIVAKASVLGEEQGIPLMVGSKRDEILTYLIDELHGVGMGPIGDRLKRQVFGLAGALVTWKIKGRRGAYTDKASPFSGDILLYQARGEDIRHYIRDRITATSGPVTVLAHSLGGIAAVDVLMKEKLDQVQGLITVGSQASFLYELDALSSLRWGEPLPQHFPSWLNIYDANDFLSYVGEPIFHERVRDVRVDNEQPFPQSHSAYWTNPTVWEHIREFVG